MNSLARGGVPVLVGRHLDRIYRMPNETVSYEDAARLRHWDVPGLSDLDLWREDKAAGLRLLYEAPGWNADWLRRRRIELRAEMDRRRATVRVLPVVKGGPGKPSPVTVPEGFVAVRGGARRGR